ncbi:protein phosphatase PTC7 homolog [Anastrepha obliqua]|uniref:protein phosphatase PTC7 homolog n=1 Tax=Anastrepha ludens TaxID=28586 RepID=UPI0023AF34AC|nr:protein phosphatase PTC7 homolog [Anastrepha ludens]XP_054730808.1 protein phosphatase PTC7 homolog [Anastrepha obliqua]
MHSLSWTTRVISRALRSGFSTLLETASNATANVNSASKQRPHFVSVVCGFPKDFLTSKYKPGKYGEDSWFKASTINADVLGVADGVGGWRNYGIDPGEFSSFLMKTCERLVHCVNFNPQRPVNLLAYSYCELLEQKKPILGSSTACVLVLNRENSTVYTANIGDSGFMVVRKGEIIHKSEEQQHYFNTPFQLSLPPPGHGHNVLSDSPDSADTISFSVKEGDVILVATDGVFDNVPERLLLDVLKECEGVTDPVKLQMTANSLALMARSLSFDSEFMSPFAINARRNNINATGGKPDDITVVLATVAM